LKQVESNNKMSISCHMLPFYVGCQKNIPYAVATG